MAKKHSSVILLKDVKGLGKAKALVKAPAGYVRNFLIPGGYAVVATDKLQEEHKKRQARELQQSKVAHENAGRLAQKLSASTVTVRVKAGKNGKLFGSVSAKDIVEAAKNQLDVSLTSDMFAKSTALKKLGKHSLDVSLTDEVTANLTVQVVSQKA